VEWQRYLLLCSDRRTILFYVYQLTKSGDFTTLRLLFVPGAGSMNEMATLRQLCWAGRHAEDGDSGEQAHVP